MLTLLMRKLHSVERFMYSTITHNESLEELNHVQTFLDYQENLKKFKLALQSLNIKMKLI